MELIAKYKTTLEVKQEHIDKGVAKNCYICPIALALTDKLGVACAVGLKHGGGKTKNGIEIIVKVTPEMKKFIKTVEGGKIDTLTPATFDIVVERYKHNV